MSIIEKMAKIVNDGDVAAGEKLIHDDYQFLMHASGKKLGKQDILKWLGMKDVQMEKVRVLLKMIKLDSGMLLQVIKMEIKKQL